MKTIVNVSLVTDGAGNEFFSNPVTTVIRDKPCFIPFCYCWCRCCCDCCGCCCDCARCGGFCCSRCGCSGFCNRTVLVIV